MKNMKKTFIVGTLLVALSLSSSASVAFAQTTTGAQASTTTTVDQSAQSTLLMKQIEMLKAQIMELQKSQVALQQNVAQLQEELKLVRILKRGDKGDDVKLLQEMLGTDATIFNGEATGFFGPKTMEAIKKLQEKMGLDPVGAVGPKTLERLNKILSEGAGHSGKIPPGLLKEHGRGIMIPLKSVGDAGVMGFAGVSMMDAPMTSSTGTMATSGKIKVHIELWEKKMTVGSTTGTATAIMSRPAHIHTGSCEQQGGIKWPLNPVVNGRSETTLDISIQDLVTAMPLYINVHKSAEELATAVSCGDIKKPSRIWKKHDMDWDKKMGDMMEDKNHMSNSGKGSHMWSSSSTHQFGRGSQMRDSSSVVEARKFDIVGSNFAFDVKEIRVKKGDVVKLKLKSADGFHDIVINEFNVRSKQINTGADTDVVFTADKAGTFEYYCSVGNHRAMGMIGKLIVE